MGFRSGVVVGFAAGFYLGSWAGRERHEQINKALHRVKQSDAFDAATGKAKAVVDLGKERAKDIVESKRGRDAGQYSRVPNDAPAAEFTKGANGDGSG